MNYSYPYGIPRPDKIRIGFSWDQVGYTDPDKAELAYKILLHHKRNPSNPNLRADGNMTFINYRR